LNLALPALAIILGLLPGIVFFHGYFSGRFPKQLAAISGVSELGLYVMLAVPLDALGIAVTSLFNITLDYGLAARLILGQVTVATDLATRVHNSWALTTLTYSAVLLGSFLAGNVLRKIVWTFRVDVKVSLLRMKHEWYYVLQGRLPALPREVVPFTDVLMEHAGSLQRYQGIVSSFEVNREGGISQLILREAHKGQGLGVRSRWKRIPGDRFIIMGSAIRSINMRYIVIQPVQPTDGPAARQPVLGTVRAGRDLLRRFLLEEP